MTSWSRCFDDPIPLPGGGQLITLRDAGAFLAALPKAEQEAPHWQAAAEALLLVVNQNGPTMFARIGMMQALSRGNPKDQPPRRKRSKAYRIVR